MGRLYCRKGKLRKPSFSKGKEVTSPSPSFSHRELCLAYPILKSKHDCHLIGEETQTVHDGGCLSTGFEYLLDVYRSYLRNLAVKPQEICGHRGSCRPSYREWKLPVSWEIELRCSTSGYMVSGSFSGQPRVTSRGYFGKSRSFHCIYPPFNGYQIQGWKSFYLRV